MGPKVGRQGVRLTYFSQTPPPPPCNCTRLRTPVSSPAALQRGTEGKVLGVGNAELVQFLELRCKPLFVGFPLGGNLVLVHVHCSNHCSWSMVLFQLITAAVSLIESPLESGTWM